MSDTDMFDGLDLDEESTALVEKWANNEVVLEVVSYLDEEDTDLLAEIIVAAALAKVAFDAKQLAQKAH